MDYNFKDYIKNFVLKMSFTHRSGKCEKLAKFHSQINFNISTFEIRIKNDFFRELEFVSYIPSERQKEND